MEPLNVEQFVGESNATYVERLRGTARTLKQTENSEMMVKRYLEDSLTMMRTTGAPLAARLDIQRHLTLCCHRLGVARGQQNILTARIVTALNR